MFTGIVAAVGRIDRVEPLGGQPDFGIRILVDAGPLGLADVAPGDSIAVQGACLTVVGLEGNAFTAELSVETLARTTGLDRVGAEVNLEKALRLADRLGGHLVSGHVDAVAAVSRFEPVGESMALEIDVPIDLRRYVAYKGSIVVDGVSLTINQVNDQQDCTIVAINLIPHTVAVTTLKRLQAGARVNLEVDLVARYVERMLGSGAGGAH